MKSKKIGGDMNIYRQGDILIKQVGAIPAGAKPKGDKIVALGEATGHKHRFENKEAMLLMVGEKMYLDLQAPSPLIHDEHLPIELPAGQYEISNEREYDPFEANIKAVAD